VSLWRQVHRGLRALFNRKAADREIADEIAHYLRESAASFQDRSFCRFRIRCCERGDDYHASRSKEGLHERKIEASQIAFRGDLRIGVHGATSGPLKGERTPGRQCLPSAWCGTVSERPHISLAATEARQRVGTLWPRIKDLETVSRQRVRKCARLTTKPIVCSQCPDFRLGSANWADKRPRGRAG